MRCPCDDMATKEVYMDVMMIKNGCLAVFAAVGAFVSASVEDK